jgi:hypothetical protein
MSGSAAVTLAGGTYSFLDTLGNPAGLNGSQLELQQNGNTLTLIPSATLSTNYSVTLPSAPPVSTKIVSMDSAGTVSAVYDVDNSTIEISSNNLQVKDLGITTAKLDNLSVTNAKIADATIEKTKLAPLGQAVSASSGAFTTSSSSYVVVTNLSFSFTTTGRPVMVLLINDGSGNDSEFDILRSGSDIAIGAVRFMRNSVAQASYRVRNAATGVSGIGIGCATPPYFFDESPPAGSNSYEVQVKMVTAGTFAVAYFKLVAYEL